MSKKNKNPEDICQWKVEIKDKKFGSQFITCGHKRKDHLENGRCNIYVLDPIWKGQKNYCFCPGFVEKTSSTKTTKKSSRWGMGYATRDGKDSQIQAKENFK